MADASPIAEPITDLSRCAIHTRTNKPWTLAECCAAYAGAGLGGVSVWRDAIELVGVKEAARIVGGSGLRVPALVRGGFFVAASATERTAAVDANRSCIDEARSIGAEQVVIVAGAMPGVSLAAARDQVEAGLAAVADHAQQAGVKLSIEPLHPMYAGDKSCVTRIAEARAICERLDHPSVGVAVDVYHVWWDADAGREIAALGEAGRLFGLHACDWRADTQHMLTDRGLMGDGVADIRGLRAACEAAGFAGMVEVEIFSEHYWAMNQRAYLDLICERLRTHT